MLKPLKRGTKPNHRRKVFLKTRQQWIKSVLKKGKILQEQSTRRQNEYCTRVLGLLGMRVCD